MLKENLLEDELKIPHIPVETDLSEAVRRFQEADQRSEESIKERYTRLAAKETLNMFTLVAYTCVVALYITATTISYLASFSHILGLMFSVSILIGPTVLYQRLTITYYDMQREFLGELWNHKEKLQRKNTDLSVKHEFLFQKSVGLKKSEERLTTLAKKSGYSSTTVVMDLYNENQSINQSRRELLDAIELIKITKLILNSDRNRDHIIGDAELALIAVRMIDAADLDIPYTAEELCNRFRLVKVRSINNLAFTACNLFIERRRQQRKQQRRQKEKISIYKQTVAAIVGN